jgi:hypothetical protein
VTSAYIPPQDNENNKLALNKLYEDINKLQTVHPEAALPVISILHH